MTETAPQVDAGQVDNAAPATTDGQATETTTTTTWYDGANDETIGFLENKGWKDEPLKAIEAYQNLEKFQGVPADQLIKLPKDMSEDGAMDAIYDKLGRPESADKYNLELPEGVAVDEDRMAWAKEVGHKIGLSNTQLQALASADAEYMQNAYGAHGEEFEQKMLQEETALKKEWGNAFEERAELGRRYLRANLPEGVDKNATLDAIEQAIGLSTTLKLFANAGEKASGLREDSVPDTSGDRPFGYTREQATFDRKSLMDDLRGDKTRLDNYNKGKGSDIDKMKRLNDIITS